MISSHVKEEDDYPFLDRLARDTGVEREKLVQAYKIEREFHYRILMEPDAERRAELYREVYAQVHPLYGVQRTDLSMGNPKDRVVRLFRQELTGKSVLEVGCGEGHFLRSLAHQLPHRELVGLDVSSSALPADDSGIRFVNADIIDFDLETTFDVVYSEHVIEHLAPADVPRHLSSVARALHSGGCFILMAPNRLFGPHDVTRIVDYTYTNAVPSVGTHLNEPTYGELLPLLKAAGFRRFRTICPVMKVRYWLPWFRMSPTIMTNIEQSRVIMGCLHAVHFRSQCLARFETVVICRR